mmetsp:Transcript_12714/g.19117  ORF Transcript_12714/g.19117 Transcript_12714/m.19117 type:complete len:317 (+) Transcript_12714:250-1200(+)
MGRKKIEIKPIEDERNRHVTFNKRKSGLVKKAMELSILCNSKISLIIFDENHLYEYCSDDPKNVLDEYCKVAHEPHERLNNADYHQFEESGSSKKKKKNNNNGTSSMKKKMKKENMTKQTEPLQPLPLQRQQLPPPPPAQQQQQMVLNQQQPLMRPQMMMNPQPSTQQLRRQQLPYNNQFYNKNISPRTAIRNSNPMMMKQNYIGNALMEGGDRSRKRPSHLNNSNYHTKDNQRRRLNSSLTVEIPPNQQQTNQDLKSSSSLSSLVKNYTPTTATRQGDQLPFTPDLNNVQPFYDGDPMANETPSSATPTPSSWNS